MRGGNPSKKEVACLEDESEGSIELEKKGKWLRHCKTSLVEDKRDGHISRSFFKIQSLPNSPTHRAVIGPLGDPTPRMERINELCTQYQVQTLKILTFVSEIPLGTYPPIRICPFLETKKQGLLNEEMRAIFLAH